MKIIKIFYLILTITSFISCKNGIKANKAFIEEVAKYYSQQASLTADVEYKINFFDYDDTTTYKTQVKMVRDIKDTIYGGNIWYNVYLDSTYKNIEKYYDQKNAYFILKDSEKIIRYDVKKGETFIIDGASDGEAKSIYFLKPEKLTEILNDSLKQTVVTDTVVDNKDYALLTIKYPDEDDYSNQAKKIFINKETKVIEKITFYSMYLDQFQYNEWNITNTKFNSVTNTNLEKKLKELSSKYKVEDYKPRTEEEMAPLAAGTQAPDFTAKLYKDNKEIKLSDYKGKIIVLDFWYMSCQPCVMAISHLNKIQEKYKDKVIVLGVNASDTDENQIAKIPDFIKRHQLNYSIAMIDKAVVESYNIYGFPTVYVIDRNGTIQYAAPGFSEELEKKLDDAIKKL